MKKRTREFCSKPNGAFVFFLRRLFHLPCGNHVKAVKVKTLSCAFLSGILILITAVCANAVSPNGNDVTQKLIHIAAADNVSPAVMPPSKFSMDILPQAFYLEWKLSPQDPGIVTGYEIMRAPDYKGPYERIALVNKGSSHYEDFAIKQNGAYFYKIRAVAGNKYSPFSTVLAGELPPY